MANSVWPAFATLLGALLGGGISLATQRVAERGTAKRHAQALLEARRPERLSHLIAFIQTAQDAERIAKYIHQDGLDEAVERANATLDRLWITLRPVQMLCSEEVATAAHALAVQAHLAVREGPGKQTISAFLRPSREELINAARIDLDAGSPFKNPALKYPGD